jgi:hypothetical protein
MGGSRPHGEERKNAARFGTRTEKGVLRRERMWNQGKFYAHKDGWSYQETSRMVREGGPSNLLLLAG